MPRYLFHTENGDGYIDDEEGQELPDIEAARLEALKSAGEFVAGEMARGCTDVTLVIYIAAESDLRRCLCPFP